MSKQLLERIPFGKVIVAQTILFGIALGLCRLDAHLTEHGQKITGTIDEFIFLTSLMQLGMITLTGVGIIIIGNESWHNAQNQTASSGRPSSASPQPIGSSRLPHGLLFRHK